MQCGLVILADPHPSALEGLRRLLATEVESVMMVAEGGALLRAVEKMDPDLVVADLSLPVPGPENVVRMLKKIHPATKLIVMSMHDEGTVVNEVMEAGAEGFVLKDGSLLICCPDGGYPSRAQVHIARYGAT